MDANIIYFYIWTNLYLIRVTPGSRDPTAAFAFLALLETTNSFVGIFILISLLYHKHITGGDTSSFVNRLDQYGTKP